jgi:hypothetical protein
LLLQIQTSGSPINSKRPPSIVALVDQARALPEEFSADLLLRLASSQLIPDLKWKEELIEEAFWSGPRASLPYLQYSVDRSDSVASNAVRANLHEALTLQTRAVEAMLSLDSQRALRLYEQIVLPTLPKLACTDATTPDLSAYYQTAAALFESGFTPKQRAKGDDLHFLTQRASSVESPSQVSPALRMIFAVKITNTQRNDLLSILATRLNTISSTDRTYGSAEAGLIPAINQDRFDSSDAAVLLPPLGAYIVRHVSAKRCTDNIPAEGKLSPSAQQFNDLAAKFDATVGGFKPITAKEAQPSGDDGTCPRVLFWQSPYSKQVDAALRWLTHDNRVKDGEAQRWTLEELSNQDWLAHFDDAANLIDDWKEQNENSREEYVYMKCHALMTLALLAPPGPTRDRNMAVYIAFLGQGYAAIPNHNFWFTLVRHILYEARFSDDPKQTTWILDQLARSSNPIIALYATLERRLGAPDQSFPAR